MRFKQPRHGDKRIVRMFLWFPCTLNYETRWLEFAQIQQEFSEYGKDGWIDRGWVDEEEE